MIFTEGLGNPAGLLSMPDGSWLVATTARDGGRLIRLSCCGRQKRIFADNLTPTGLLLDKEGSDIWVTEAVSHSLIKLDASGSEMFRLKGSGQNAFYWPNDLAYGPDGCIYMTDAGVLVSDLMTDKGPNPEIWKSGMQGRLYRIDPVSLNIECLDKGLQFASGIAFGTDGCFYLAESVTGHIHRYRFTDQLEVSSREIYATVTDLFGPRRVSGPAGIVFDKQGNLYTAIYGQGHIACVNSNGIISRSLVTRGSRPVHLCFGAKGHDCLYVTESQQGRIEKLTLHSF